jgi:hypothetical protein
MQSGVNCSSIIKTYQTADKKPYFFKETKLDMPTIDDLLILCPRDPSRPPANLSPIPTTMTYSLDLPGDRESSNYVSIHLEAQSFVPINPKLSSLIRKAFDSIEDYANIKLIETPFNEAEFHLFEFIPSKKSGSPLGCTDYRMANSTPYQTSILLNQALETRNDAEALSICLHEGLHAVLQCDHPFRLYTQDELQLSSYSRLNYRDEYAHRDQRIIAVTPMRFEIEAIKLNLGINPRAGRGNNVYSLNEFVWPQNGGGFDPFYTISTFPWDPKGEDTVSSIFLKKESKVYFNLNVGKRSLIDKHYIVMLSEIENFISGPNNVSLTLNNLNNKIDFHQAKNGSIIYIYPTHCGNDTIIGFNPLEHRLILKYLPPFTEDAFKQTFDNTTKRITIGNSVQISNYRLKLQMDGENSITFENLLPDALNANNCYATCNKQTVNCMLSRNITLRPSIPAATFTSIIEKTSFNNIALELFSDVLLSALRGMTTTYIFTQAIKQFKKWGFSPDDIALGLEAVRIFLSLISDSMVSYGAAVSTTFILRNLGWSEESAMLAANAVSTGVKAYTECTYLGAAKVIVSAVSAYYSSNAFTLWANKKPIPKTPSSLHKTSQDRQKII